MDMMSVKISRREVLCVGTDFSEPTISIRIIQTTIKERITNL